MDSPPSPERPDSQTKQMSSDIIHSFQSCHVVLDGVQVFGVESAGYREELKAIARLQYEIYSFTSKLSMS